MITFEVYILAYPEAEEHNTFSIKIIFRQRIEGSIAPHPIEDLRIVFGYLWHNPYHQIAEEEQVCTPSSFSLATGVIASENPTPVNTPSPPQSLHEVIGLPPILPVLPELPGISDYNRRVEAL